LLDPSVTGASLATASGLVDASFEAVASLTVVASVAPASCAVALVDVPELVPELEAELPEFTWEPELVVVVVPELWPAVVPLLPLLEV
jgi:dissimilatory sulfite reductase (desulfoviridin) alpha/beta subunit